MFGFHFSFPVSSSSCSRGVGKNLLLSRRFSDLPKQLQADEDLLVTNLKGTNFIALDEQPQLNLSSAVCTVFGPTSFLGRYVVSLLGRAGSQVVAPYRGEENEVRDLKVMGDVGQIAPYNFNVRDPRTVEKAISHSQVVINLIGSKANTRNFSIHAANVETARTIAQAAKKMGTQRFIHVSCLGASLNAPSAYLRAKAEAEEIVKQLIPSATILRPAMMFGEEDKFLNKIGLMIRLTPLMIPLPIRGSALIQPVNVLDVASAIVNILTNEDTMGKTYELGGPEVYKLMDLLQNVALRMTRSEKSFLPLPTPFNKILAWCAERTRRGYWTTDEIHYFETDNIVRSGSLTFKDLQINPMSIYDHDTVLNIFRPYRKPEKSADYV